MLKRLHPHLSNITSTLLLTLAIVFMIAAVVLNIIFRLPAVEVISAENGVADLRAALSDGKIALIKGEWDVYYNELFEYEDLLIVPPTETANFPDVWTGARSAYATYHTKILTPQSVDSIGIYVRPQYSAHKAFVDSILICESGNLDPTGNNFLPGLFSTSGTANISNVLEEFDFIIQIQNKLHAIPGFRGEIFVGTARDMNLTIQSLTTLTGILSGCFIATILYFILAYINKRQRTEYLYTCLTSFAMLFLLVTYAAGEDSLYQLMPTARLHDLLMHFEYMAFFMLSVFIFERTLSLYMRRKTRRIYHGIVLGVCLVYLFLPTPVLTALVIPNQILNEALVLVALVFRIIKLKEYDKRSYDFGLEIVSLILYFGSFLSLVLNIRFFKTLDLFFATMLAYVMVQLILLMYYYGRAESEIEELNRDLEVRIEERTIELEELVEEARTATEAKSAFLARMSHEIRTPMNAIIGLSELILDRLIDEQCINYAENIRHASYDLLAIINDILDFSKLDSGNFMLNVEEYDVGAMLENIESIIQVRVSEKPITFITDISSDVPAFLLGDQIRVKQLIMNLLSNAVKYTDRGEIRFTVKSEQLSMDSVRLSIIVADTGIGIRKEDLAHMFEDFVQLENAKSRTYGGTGLGLAIVKGLCISMGGDVAVESELNVGTTFTATILQSCANFDSISDVTTQKRDVNVAVRELALFTAPKFRILVVDDSPTNLLVASALLERFECDITTSESGADSVRLAEQNEYDLIFMDYMMPGMDGVEATSRIRELPGYLYTPIVALTANAVAGMREMFLANGFTEFLSKPIELQKLSEIIDEFVPEELRVYIYK